MKPVVSAAQIAAQAYAQKTIAPRSTALSGFVVDAKAAPSKGATPVRRITEETEAFKIEISAEALDAASRDGGRSAQTAEAPVADGAEDAAKVVFQPFDSVSLNNGRREAPFAHEKLAVTKNEAPRLPGSVLDITI
mgnify:FL=1